MKAVAFSPAAQADIGEIWDYSADRWGPDQADNYIDAIRDACYALARGTKHGRPAEVLPDFQKYLCGSHVVYFLNYPDHLDVIRVLHQRQDAERHL
ncbi:MULTISPECIES: type II toxin-antitoxin system RelE/ParE family toxin [Comamonadaceae]|uniref:Toxin n=1 Tax=Serpentinimonas maccroryi TaxID=1458426 RepID=A0A060NPW9_9BURK|nr:MULTISPECIES: type II toxin-antitoxin system RelE/ParE family toxin [Comamonadaceae]KJS70572.1 MAG: plasmid stabilization protein ParE [Comamonadaceae bacterium BICA1-1]MCL5968269.1 type II toxin-antitoxin system RelE/ParE family toxin [Betaproteobacteria bacterium]HQS65098.1 type II toxin-antitoxin system RelE/ParE family toxin [Acidovorax defluvii]OYY25721.1 MAG: plasmid stabilization protein ParE [Acidovorax sp. 35-64-16]OYZ42671.1 MAG: plasmid stabilization protein ParE [Acidovorax sp. 